MSASAKRTALDVSRGDPLGAELLLRKFQKGRLIAKNGCNYVGGWQQRDAPAISWDSSFVL